MGYNHKGENMTKITIELSEEEYRDSKSASGENRDEAIRVVGWRAMDAYEAEQRKIGFGEWALHNESGDITLIKEGDNLSAVNSNFTKLSPEAQDILNKETGKIKERIIMNKKLFELIYIGFFAYVFLIGLYVHFYFLIKFLKGML